MIAAAALFVAFSKWSWWMSGLPDCSEIVVSVRRGLAPAESERSPLVELASGVDALYCSGRVELPAAFLASLERAREEAEITGVDVPVVVGETEFRVQSRGFGLYRYWLVHANGAVGVTPSAFLPAFRVQPRAAFLHGVGARQAVAWFRAVLGESCVYPIEFTTSRLDLHADWQGWELTAEDRCNFVCRSKIRVTHEDGDVLSGLRFGQRRTGTISARIYDKTLEIRTTGDAYWEEIWGDRYDRSRPVVRVEFELGRQGLTEFGIRSPEDAIDGAGALWSYVTGAWLSLRTPTEDTTRSRWPVAPAWERIRHASIADSGWGIERVGAGRRRGQVSKLVPFLVGYVVSYAAWFDIDTVEDVCERLVEVVHGSCTVRGLSFEKRVAARRRELGLR